jgi:hypothetical protein
LLPVLNCNQIELIYEEPCRKAGLFYEQLATGRQLFPIPDSKSYAPSTMLFACHTIILLKSFTGKEK